MAVLINILGQIFTRLVVIKDLGPRLTYGASKHWWKCRCSCGKTVEAATENLREGRIKSCGCLKASNLKFGVEVQKHGHALKNKPSPTYKIWQGVRRRCNNPNTLEYKHYGARGIKICGRWNNFANFLQDMGARPEGLSLDRIDVNGDYEPSNCRWSQMLNKVETKVIM
jgi:hypothetical protein